MSAEFKGIPVIMKYTLLVNFSELLSNEQFTEQKLNSMCSCLYILFLSNTW